MSFLSFPAGRLLAGATGLLLLATLVSLAILWPNERRQGAGQAFGGKTVSAKVVRADLVPCGPQNQDCRRIIARVTEGRDAGRRVSMDLGPVAATQDLAAGDAIRVTRNEPVPELPDAPPYGYVDVDRRAPLFWLSIAFVVVGVAVARTKGLLAVLGLIASGTLVVTFLVPAILEGTSPLLVSLVASLAVMFVTLLLTYGVRAQSLAAAVGIGTCLLLATLLGWVALDATHLDGRGGELYPMLQQAGAGDLSLQGIVLAGMVIAALGVLTDTAVTQASAVMALRRANPALGVAGLYREAFVIGRDHLAATMHTLVLVYVGTTLPLLLVIEAAGVSAVDALNGQFLAEPLVAILVGAIALMASVPLTTFLTAMLAVRLPPEALPETHAHVH